MKIKILNTLKSTGIIVPAGQIITDDDIPEFIKKLIDSKSGHVEILQEEIVTEIEPKDTLVEPDPNPEPEIDLDKIEEKTSKKRK